VYNLSQSRLSATLFTPGDRLFTTKPADLRSERQNRKTPSTFAVITAANIYIWSHLSRCTDMLHTVSRFTALALYQLTVLLGIALLPVALAARRVGLQLSVRPLLDRLDATADSL
jgi:hypothetical protein